jgi:hypothetical protein
MSILPCHHPVPALPGALPRNQIVLPAVHGADDDAPPERLSARPRRLAAPYPAPFPLAGSLRRTCGASGPDTGKPADGQPRRPAARSAPGRRARPDHTPGYCHRLDIAVGGSAGYHRSWAAGQPVLLPGPAGSRVIRGTRTAPMATAREPRPLARATPKRRTPGGRRLP